MSLIEMQVPLRVNTDGLDLEKIDVTEHEESSQFAAAGTG
jgi:hypothetical protein